MNSDRRPDTLVEEGAAWMNVAGVDLAERGTRVANGTSPSPQSEHVSVIVIGGGQAGLSVGYHLARRGIRFVILDASPRIGDAWRNRWDSLRLFTPARFDGLDGMRFPAPGDSFPTRNEMGDYLERYAKHFNLPVRSGIKVDELTRVGNRYRVAAGPLRFEADHVVVAMANFQRRRVPAFAAALDPAIVQMHSSEYRSPAQLRPGGVLIVGAGNSGAEIARELARYGHAVSMSGRSTGHIPFRIEGFAGRHLLVRLVIKGLFHFVLTTDSPIGHKARPHILSQGGPLIRVKPRDLAAAGVARVARTERVCDGRPVLADGRELDVSNVIWCTGYDPGFSWIKLDVFEEHDRPRHRRGEVEGEPGLYFVGLEFLYAMSSIMIHGVGRDARHVAGRIAARTGAPAIA
ncbi:MAG: FAD-dependent oxidoreductase [Candidatus Eisenbacteria bacterium]